MGCSDSKLSSLPAVSLCRSRSDRLSLALRLRFSLSHSHSLHSQSLLSLSDSLHSLLHDIPLPLPSPRKPDPLPDSHIIFTHSDSDSETSSSSSHSPLHHIHYARGNPPPPSVAFTDRPHPVQFQQPVPETGFDQYYGPGFFGTPTSPGVPPSPPRASAWEFLNPFQASGYNGYYATPGDEEGIPELEDEVHEEEVVKEAYGDEKSVGGESKVTSTSKNDGGGPGGYGGSLHLRKQSEGVSSSGDDEGSVVEKNVAHEEPAVRFRDDSEAVNVIKAEFDRAAEAAGELSMLLEVGKPQYHQNSAHKASSMVKSVIPHPSSANYADLSTVDEDILMNSRSLSSTLQKLYLWEKKLYEEVRTEEKMRLLLDKNCKRLKHLDEKGAESNKIDSTRALVNKLSTKIRISIKVVDSISNKINTLRDEELCLQINELILGFTRMWNVMLECYRNQCQAISEAKNLDFIANKGAPTDSHMEAVMQFELELLRWIANFSDWISAQKNFVKALNEWLVLCLHYEPEITADGIPPYSPGRIGAPPIFVICNYWSQAMDQISEKEVVLTMQSFAANVRHLWDQNNAEQRQMMMAGKDMERWLKTREREQQIIHKELDALNKKLVLVPGHNGLPLHRQVQYHDTSVEVGSLQLGLKQLFEVMESFAASSVKAYEELNLRAEEERLSRENVKVT